LRAPARRDWWRRSGYVVAARPATFRIAFHLAEFRNGGLRRFGGTVMRGVGRMHRGRVHRGRRRGCVGRMHRGGDGAEPQRAGAQRRVMICTFCVVLGCTACDAKFCVCAFVGAVSRLPLAYVHSRSVMTFTFFMFVCNSRDAMFRICAVCEFNFRLYIGTRVFGHCTVWWRTSGWRSPGIYLFWILPFAFGLAHLFSIGVSGG